ncbi:MAG: glycosyltransferase family 39 protein [Polyangia bacterium]
MTERRGCWAWAVALLAALFSVARLVPAALLELAPDEAYYWTWSLSPAWSFPDHPPAIAWLVRAGTAIAGEGTIGVRLASVLLGASALALIYRIGRESGADPRHSLCAAVVAAWMPVPAAGALLATPDALLGLCWLVAVLALLRLVSNPRALSPWIALGASLGAGMLAKHQALLILPLAATALLDRRVRAVSLGPRPLLALAVACAIALPHLLAESAAGWPSYRFQLAHLSGDLPGATSYGAAGFLLRPLELVAGQLGLITPLLAWLAVLGLAQSAPDRPRRAVIGAGLLLPIAAALLVSPLAHPEQSWASLGHPLAAVAALSLPDERAERNPRRTGGWRTAAIALTLAVTAAAHIHALFPLLPLPPERDPISRLHGWSDLSARASALPLARSREIWVCDNYGLAAELAWSLRNLPGGPAIFSADRGEAPPPGDWLVLDEIGDWAGAPFPSGCERHTSIATLRAERRDGEVVRRVEVGIGGGCRSDCERGEKTAPR